MRVQTLITAFGIVVASQAHAALIDLSQAAASTSQGGLGVNQAIDGITVSTAPNLNGWAIGGNNSHQTAVFETVHDVNFQTSGGQVEFKLIQDYTHPSYLTPEGNAQDYHQIGKFTLSYTLANRSSFADGNVSGGQLGADSIWTVLNPTSYKVYFRDGTYDPSATLTKQSDNSILAGGSNHRGYYIIDAALNELAVTGFRIDVLTDSSLPYSGPGREPSNGNFVLTEFQVSSVPEPSTYLAGLSALGMLGMFGWRNRK